MEASAAAARIQTVEDQKLERLRDIVTNFTSSVKTFVIMQDSGFAFFNLNWGSSPQNRFWIEYAMSVFDELNFVYDDPYYDIIDGWKLKVHSPD